MKLIPLVTPDTNVWASVFVEGITSNTWTSNVFVVTLETSTHLLLMKSVERGYAVATVPLVAPTLTVIVPAAWSTAVINKGVLYAGSVARG